MTKAEYLLKTNYRTVAIAVLDQLEITTGRDWIDLTSDIAAYQQSDAGFTGFTYDSDIQKFFEKVGQHVIKIMASEGRQLPSGDYYDLTRAVAWYALQLITAEIDSLINRR